MKDIKQKRFKIVLRKILSVVIKDNNIRFEKRFFDLVIRKILIDICIYRGEVL